METWTGSQELNTSKEAYILINLLKEKIPTSKQPYQLLALSLLLSLLEMHENPDHRRETLPRVQFRDIGD